MKSQPTHQLTTPDCARLSRPRAPTRPRLALASPLALALLLFTTPAPAALTLTLAPSSQVAAPAAEVIFSGTLTNTSATDKLFLNDHTLAASSSIELRPNAFFANVPGILLAGESYTGPLFMVKLSAVASPADYTGSITLAGGASIEATSALASASFTLLATPVSQWRYQTFGPAANSAAATDTADFDKDGSDNLLEYALGTDATSTSSTPSIPSGITANHLALSYSPAPAATDVTFTIEASTNLITWSSSNIELVTPGTPGVMTYRYAPAVGIAKLAFLRLRVSR